MLKLTIAVALLLSSVSLAIAEKPVRSEIIDPIRNVTFNKEGACKIRQQGGRPRQMGQILVFDGANDGNRQVDPQIAVGKNHVLHATNTGLIIYSKSGEFVQGVSQRCFQGGIDPKLFYSAHQDVFGFDLWNPWDKEKKKPVNISISETGDPTGAWNTYPVPAPGGRDGGGIGFSRQWIGYSFPGGSEQTFVMKIADAKSGKSVSVYHFKGNLGQPVATQDPEDDLYFLKLTRSDLVITRVFEGEGGLPESDVVANVKHSFKYFGWPPQSPQLGTDKKTASGDRNPKNVVMQGGCFWFSHTVNGNGRAAVQWHQVQPDGTFVQSGLISDPQRSFIQTTIAVNRRLDVLVGFQETGPDMFISPRFAFRRVADPLGTLRKTVAIGEGKAATAGGAWGDYSGAVVDGDNQLDLWTIQSIADAEGKGDTVIAKLPVGK